MKKLSTRALALFLALLFIFTASITAFAATGTAVTKNYGNRTTVCTSLSDQAEDYYADNSVLYTYLDDLSASVLLSTLRTLIGTGTNGTHKKITSYDDCKNYADETDCENGKNNVSLIYTGILADWDDNSASAPGWNREHVWPKSLGGFENSGAGADLHHIRPSDVTNNSNRDNLKYGEVTSNAKTSNATITTDYLGNSISSEVRVGGTYNSTYYEPTDDFKGDVARICLYVYVRYGGSLSKCNSITNVFQSVDVLLEWCALDPVDTWEMGRNDVVEGIQGNRNVFIDYPELAWQLFGRSTPDNLVTPTGSGYTGDGTGSGSGSTTPSTPSTPSTPARKTLTELNTGDEVLIAAPAYNKLLSMVKVATHYNKGVDYTPSDFSGVTNDEIFVVTKNSDGSYSFTSKSGKVLAMAGDYASLNDTGANSKWSLTLKSGTTDVFYVKNTVRGNYLEWFSSKDNWSTYTSNSDDQFEISFYSANEEEADPDTPANPNPDDSGTTTPPTDDNGGTTTPPTDDNGTTTPPADDNTDTPSDDNTDKGDDSTSDTTDPDEEEELNFFERLIKAIREFFEKLFGGLFGSSDDEKTEE